MAKKLRELARKFRFAGARQELLNLALRYERRADSLDARSAAEMKDRRPGGGRGPIGFPQVRSVPTFAAQNLESFGLR